VERLMSPPTRICIYTAVFGDYTLLKAPSVPCEAVDMVCFSDRAQHAGPAWQVRHRQRRFLHPRMDSKWCRMLSHAVLSEYDHTIWVDASFLLGDVQKFVDLCVSALDQSDTALFLHPERQDILSEAEASTAIWRNKYAGEPLLQQVRHYQDHGLPSPHRLWAGGIQIRNNRSARIAELNSLWMEECVRWSYQDQLSLPYVLWKLGVEPAVIPGNIYQGDHHQWAPGPDL